jgi:hypothetical protein
VAGRHLRSRAEELIHPGHAVHHAHQQEACLRVTYHYDPAGNRSSVMIVDVQPPSAPGTLSDFVSKCPRPTATAYRDISDAFVGSMLYTESFRRRTSARNVGGDASARSATLQSGGVRLELRGEQQRP